MIHFLLEEKTPQLALIDDELVSFNINRSCQYDEKSERQVVMIPRKLQNNVSYPADIMIVPGVKERGETDLTEELKKFQNWKCTRRFSFKISPRLFSFLWRYKIADSSAINSLKWKAPVEGADAQNIQNVYKQYQDYLKHGLSPGQVYLIPDRDVTFNTPGRVKKIYARYVLVVRVKNHQVSFIPFTTQIKRNKNLSGIVFDREYKGEALNKEDQPVVENFPYAIFKKKTGLIVKGLQHMDKEAFLDIALNAVGSVRKEVVDFILEKN